MMHFIGGSIHGTKEGRATFFYGGEETKRARMQTGYKLKTGSWHHLLISVRTGQAAMYLNGKEVSSVIGEPFKPIAFNSITIGTRTDETKHQMSGQIDELRLYERALTPSEAKQLYNIGNW